MPIGLFEFAKTVPAHCSALACCADTGIVGIGLGPVVEAGGTPKGMENGLGVDAIVINKARSNQAMSNR